MTERTKKENDLLVGMVVTILIGFPLFFWLGYRAGFTDGLLVKIEKANVAPERAH